MTTSLDRKEYHTLRIQRVPSASYLEAHGGVVLTFGVFDGVTRVHRAILAQVRSRAELLNARSMAIVFRPRPREIARELPPKPFATEEEETVRLMRGLGIDHVGVLRFNYTLAMMRSGEFLPLLQRRIPVRELWLGDGAQVGNGFEGTLPQVQLIASELGFAVRVFYYL